MSSKVQPKSKSDIKMSKAHLKLTKKMLKSNEKIIKMKIGDHQKAAKSAKTSQSKSYNNSHAKVHKMELKSIKKEQKAMGKYSKKVNNK